MDELYTRLNQQFEKDRASYISDFAKLTFKILNKRFNPINKPVITEDMKCMHTIIKSLLELDGRIETLEKENRK